MTDELHQHAMQRREKTMALISVARERPVERECPDQLEEYDLHHGGLQQRKDIIE